MTHLECLLLACLLVVPYLVAAGCIIPYAYPKLSYVPGCDPGPEVSDVHAFRVDVNAERHHVISIFSVGERGEHTLAEITPRADGRIPSQTRVTVERGWGLLASQMDLSVGRLHTTRVRLYRPGYQLVELKAWDLTNNIDWQPATDWEAQERAIDDLLDRPVLTPLFAALMHPSRQHPLMPTTLDTTRPLLFAASEYERLAKSAPTIEDAARVRKKAHSLNEKQSAPREPKE
jgi:hypothetical protein